MKRKKIRTRRVEAKRPKVTGHVRLRGSTSSRPKSLTRSLGTGTDVLIKKKIFAKKIGEIIGVFWLKLQLVFGKM
jgi:hypothetical protein